MNFCDASVEILTPLDGKEILRHIERCGRVCYKSEDKIEDGSAERFVGGIIKRGHEAVLEHFSITVKFVVDRGVSHEIVRHRVASYCQESTRYCNYGSDKFDGGVTFVWPCYLRADSKEAYEWANSCEQAEKAYLAMLRNKCTPQEARAVLPNSTKTELVMTANLREWRHFLKLRTSRAAHPQIREVAMMLLAQLQRAIPVVFDDIVPEAA